MFANIGFAYKPGKFEGLFQRAQQIVTRKVFPLYLIFLISVEANGMK